MIDSGTVPIFIENLMNKSFPILQKECAWALTNMAAGSTEQTEYLIKNGVLQPLISLLSLNNPEIQEQCVWAIGNIAGDNFAFRDQILEIGIEPLVNVGLKLKNEETFKNIVWTLSNLSRGKPYPDYQKIKEVLKIFQIAIKEYSDDHDVLCDTLWALSSLTSFFFIYILYIFFYTSKNFY